MKCFYHPQADAVGQCSNCQKGICSRCAVHVDAEYGTGCPGCIIEDGLKEIPRVRRRLIMLWVFTGTVTALGTLGLLSSSGAVAILYAPLLFAAAWCFYWGWLPFWGWVRGRGFSVTYVSSGGGDPAGTILRLILIGLFIEVLIFVIIAIGLFTGIQKYLKNKRYIPFAQAKLVQMYAIIGDPSETSARTLPEPAAGQDSRPGIGTIPSPLSPSPKTLESPNLIKCTCGTFNDRTRTACRECGKALEGTQQPQQSDPPQTSVISGQVCRTCGRRTIGAGAVFCAYCGEKFASGGEAKKAAINTGQSAMGNVPVVQGTLPMIDSSPGQSEGPRPINIAPSHFPSMAPTSTKPPEPLAPLQESRQQIKSSLSSHPSQPQMVSVRTKIAGQISRRAVLVGLLGVAATSVAAGIFALVGRFQKQRTPAQSTINTARLSLAQLTVYFTASNNYAFALRASDGAVRWRLLGGGGGTPAVADGIICFKTAAWRASDGKFLWSFDPHGQLSVSAPAAANGAFYFGSAANANIFALKESDGSVLWTFNGGGALYTPSVAGDVVYVASDVFYALRASDGTLLWKSQVVSVPTAPIVAEGVIYVGSLQANYFYALTAKDGSLLWSYPADNTSLGDKVFAAPAIANGIVYVTSVDSIYALRASDGSLIWKYTTGGSISTSPAVVDGVIYVASSDYYIYALQASDGSVLWRFQTGNAFSSSPTVVQGVLFIGGVDSYMYALRVKDGTLLWRYKAGSDIHSDPVVAP